MSDRPTPEQIAATLWVEVRNDDELDPASLLFTFLVRLDEHGHVIVHPDDVPEGYHWDGITMQRCINDDCRADHLIWDFDIFGGQP